MKNKNYEIRNIKIQNAISNFEENKYAIPNFQREYVWDAEKVKDLLNSIIDNNPIGYVILWESSSKNCVDINNQNDVINNLFNYYKERESYSFIIDGQQRLSSYFINFK